MHKAQLIRSSLFALGISAAIALFIWRLSIDWTHITPRGIRDAAQDALTMAMLVSLGYLASFAAKQPTIGAQVRSNQIKALSLVLALALGAITLFNGYLANQRLACRDRVLSEAAAAGRSASAAISKCFDASTVE